MFDAWLERKLAACAVGREITRDDDLGGMDWKTRCPHPPGRARLFVVELGEFLLCPEHAAHLLPRMAEARQERLTRDSWKC